MKNVQFGNGLPQALPTPGAMPMPQQAGAPLFGAAAPQLQPQAGAPLFGAAPQGAAQKLDALA